MNTEHDLRDAINELADEAPDAELLALSLEQRIARSRRTAARPERPRLSPARALVGGLVVAVVVVAVAVVAGLVQSRTKPKATPSAAASALSGVTWTIRRRAEPSCSLQRPRGCPTGVTPRYTR